MGIKGGNLKKKKEATMRMRIRVVLLGIYCTLIIE